VTHFQKDPLYRAIRASRFYDTANSSATDSFTNPAGGRGGRGGGAAGGGGGRRGNDDGNVTLNQTCVDNLKLLAQADLALDTANPSMNLMTANVLLANAIPNLRIIMDHLPSFDPTPANQQAYEAVIKEMAACPNLFVKLTEVYHPRTADGVIVKDYEFLRARLEYLYDAFGDDRVMFGSDYPNSYGVATIPEEVGLMKRFFSTKTRMQAEKYFWRNSAHIYKWVKRADDQPDPTKA
jgi:L-fuconolactonase